MQIYNINENHKTEIKTMQKENLQYTKYFLKYYI